MTEAVAMGASAQVVCPTGMQRSTYRDKFPDLDVDTTYGAYLLFKPEQQTLDLMQDKHLIIVEEIGQNPAWIFERLLRLWHHADRRPAFVMVGDFCQLRSIESERTCDSRFWHTVEKKELRTMRRCKCPELRWKLELLRTAKPSVEQLKKTLKGHKAPNGDKRSSFKMQAPTADDIAGVLQETPHTTFATITRASAALVAEWAVAYLFGGCIPEACVPADPESNPENFVGSEQVYHYVMQLAIYIGMALTLTRNLNKSGGYVNG